jgi:acetylxylan esterase
MIANFARWLLFGCISASGAFAAQGQLQRVTGNIGTNPNNLAMHIYKPSKLASPTPLLVAMHYCGGSAQAFFTGTSYADRADTKGFIVVYPQTPSGRGCFDVATNATLTHDAGGDSQGVASMIKYAITNYKVDPKLVFLAGLSSGAMMTNVMAGSYPDLFQAAAIYAGVPFSCFGGPSAWNDACAKGQITKTAEQWVSLYLASLET